MRVCDGKDWGDDVQRMYFAFGRNSAGTRPVMITVEESGVGRESDGRKVCAKPGKGVMALRMCASLGLEVCIFRVFIADLHSVRFVCVSEFRALGVFFLCIHRNIYSVRFVCVSEFRALGVFFLCIHRNIYAVKILTTTNGAIVT